MKTLEKLIEEYNNLNKEKITLYKKIIELEQKEKAIDNINNYFKKLRNKFNIKSNFKTLEIEKPEFKDGDIAFADYGNI